MNGVKAESDGEENEGEEAAVGALEELALGTRLKVVKSAVHMSKCFMLTSKPSIFSLNYPGTCSWLF